MKRLLAFAAFVSFCLVDAVAGVSPIYENYGFVTFPPQVNARIFYNQGTISLSLGSSVGGGLPFQTQNTLYFTNYGTMSASPGFRFDTVLAGATVRNGRPSFLNHIPAVSFYNRGTISAIDSLRPFLLTNVFGVSGGRPLFLDLFVSESILSVSATKVSNSGTLEVGDFGVLKLSGKNLDLSRGALIAGNPGLVDPLNPFSILVGSFGTTRRDFVNGANFFIPAIGVADIYWGGTNGAGLNLLNLPFTTPPAITSPTHTVNVRPTSLSSSVFTSGGFGGAVGAGGVTRLGLSLPLTSPADFEPHVFTNEFFRTRNFGTNGVITSNIVSVVFLKTNFTDTNITAAVRFSPGNSGFIPNFQAIGDRFGVEALVEFATQDFDPITTQYYTNSIYFIDSLGAQTSEQLLTDSSTVQALQEPSNYEITRGTPSEWLFASPENATFDPNMFFQPGFANRNVSYSWTGYGAQVERNPELVSGVFPDTFGFSSFFGQNFVLGEPTNQTSRVEITGDRVDLTLARIRAEGAIQLNVKHLITTNFSPNIVSFPPGTGLLALNAGIINGSLGSTNGMLVISNVIPQNFNRVRGNLYAWSGIWDNFETNAVPGQSNVFNTNYTKYHVLILDHSLRSHFKPTARDLTLKSGNQLFLQDDLAVNRKLLIDAPNVTLLNNLTLTDQAVNLTAGNFLHAKNFTNEAILSVANNLFLGYDTKAGFSNIVNHGTISGTSTLFRSRYFEDTGVIFANAMNIIATRAVISNATLIANQSMRIGAKDLIFDSSTLSAGQFSVFTNLSLAVSNGFFILVTNTFTNFAIGSLELRATNSITDSGTVNTWSVTDGFSLLRKPATGDLLNTHITSTALGFSDVRHVWSADDRGASPSGFSDNAAVGIVTLDNRNSTSLMSFYGTRNGTALYIDYLDLENFAQDYINGIYIDPSITIYFADSNVNPEKLNGAQNGHIIWVPDFAGPNSTQIVNRKDGSTSAMNRALAQSTTIDSDGDGIANAYDPFPLDP